MDVVILQWASEYNFDIRNKKLLELTPFFFLVLLLPPEHSSSISYQGRAKRN